MRILHANREECSDEQQQDVGRLARLLLAAAAKVADIESLRYQYADLKARIRGSCEYAKAVFDTQMKFKSDLILNLEL